MAIILQKEEIFQNKVRIIDNAYGCSHHPKDALLLVQKNTWKAADGITPEYFHSDYSFGLIRNEALDSLSPRQMIAYDIVQKWFMQAPALAYLGGRCVRNGFKCPKEDAALDNLIFDRASDACATLCAKKAYTIEYPLSATLDRVVGGLTGLVVVPIALVAGFFYTPGKKKAVEELV